MALPLIFYSSILVETGPSSFEVGLKLLMSMPTTKDIGKMVSKKKKKGKAYY